MKHREGRNKQFVLMLYHLRVWSISRGTDFIIRDRLAPASHVHESSLFEFEFMNASTLLCQRLAIDRQQS